MAFGPLVDAAWLLARIGEDALRVADCRWYLDDPSRGRREYDRLHLPSAVYVALEPHLTGDTGPGRHPLPDPSHFADTMAALGIGNEHTVVAYDDRGGAVAARLWWMLNTLGHDRVAVLDGGLPAWTAVGGRQTDVVPDHPPTELTVSSWHSTIDRIGVSARSGGTVLIDARDPERYRGESEPIDPVAGHIPGAVNHPYVDNLDESGRFAPPEELRSAFAAADVVAASDTVVYCGSGVTACHDILAMEVAGLGRAILYPGSWSDWSTSGGDVGTG